MKQASGAHVSSSQLRDLCCPALPLQVESLQAQLAGAQAQLSEAYKGKASALQDVVTATSLVAPLKEQVAGLGQQLQQVGGWEGGGARSGSSVLLQQCAYRDYHCRATR
jgi:hypothetical protein